MYPLVEDTFQTVQGQFLQFRGYVIVPLLKPGTRLVEVRPELGEALDPLGALRGLAPAIPRWTRDGAPQRYSQKEISSDDEVRSGPALLCAQARTDLLLRAVRGLSRG